MLFGECIPGIYHGSYQLGGHKLCEGFNSATFWEKRLCKCLFYYNYSFPTQCDRCAFAERFYIQGDYQIVDYEVPAAFCGRSIGEIDLVLKQGDILYATEVKPYKGNKETLLRMVAEILTYTAGDTQNTYQKAIAFFEKNREDGSLTPQQQEYEVACPQLLDILQKAEISVFRFEESGSDSYRICKL